MRSALDPPDEAVTLTIRDEDLVPPDSLQRHHGHDSSEQVGGWVGGGGIS